MLNSCEWSPERFGISSQHDYRQQTNSSSGCVGRREPVFGGLVQLRSAPAASISSRSAMPPASRCRRGRPVGLGLEPVAADGERGRLCPALSPNTKSIMDGAVPPNPPPYGQQLVDGDRTGAQQHALFPAGLFIRRWPAFAAFTGCLGKDLGEDLNGDGLPDDWKPLLGNKQSDWQPGWADSDGDGATNYEEFLAGTDPTDPKQRVCDFASPPTTGAVAELDHAAGLIYQVQTSADARTWSISGRLGSRRGQRIR